MAQPDRLENLRALRIANLDMAFATAFAALVGGNFQQAFALQLGATPRLLALISALPSILGVLQIPGSVLGEHFRSYKNFVAVGAFLWRFAWVPIVFLPIVSWPMPKLEILIACIIFSAASIFLVQATYSAWLSFLVPESHRGWYFSRRIALATVVSVAISFPASIALDWMEKHNNYTYGLSIIFGFGVLFAFISFAFYLRMPNTERQVATAPSMRASITSMAKPLQDKRFVWLLVFLAVFVFAQTFAAPFFFPYGRQVLHLEFFQFQVFGAFQAAATLLSAPMWGYLSDKYGNKPVLFISGLLLCLGPFGWAVANPNYGAWNYLILAIGHAAAGFSWTGVAVGQGNIILANTTPELRAQALGLSQALVAGVAFVAQMVGGEFMQRTLGVMPDEKRYQTLFIANGLMRIGAIGLLFFVKDATSTSIRGFLQQVARIRPKGVIAMRKLSVAGNPRQKGRAIRALGESGMLMAETEIARLLMDPSPKIRREAAEALTKMGGEEALTALVRLLERQPHLVEEEMLEAVGAIGDETAVAALTSLLQNPSSALRRASAKALGRIGSSSALEPLVAAASNPDDAELRRAAVQALRLIGDARCESVIASALRDEYPSVRVAAAEACADLGLENCAPILRELLAQEVDETFAELAYALAHVGTGHDAKLILQVAASIKSSVGRRRCLLAAARLFGVEEDFYQLLMSHAVARDQSLLEWARSDTSVRRRALGAYHRGDEQGAMDQLAKSNDDWRIAAILVSFPKDGFLLATRLLP